MFKPFEDSKDLYEEGQDDEISEESQGRISETTNMIDHQLKIESEKLKD